MSEPTVAADYDDRGARAVHAADPVAQQGFSNIAGKFGSDDAFGPQTVRLFVEGSNALGDMTPAQMQEDAFRQVRALLKALGIVK